MSGITAVLERIFTPINTTGKFIGVSLLAALVFFGVFALLHRLSPTAKKWMTIVCTFIAGLYFTLEFFIPPNPDTGTNFLTKSIDPVSSFITYALIWTLLMGIISLMLVHGRRVVKLQPGWYYSIAFFLAFFGIMITGLWTGAGAKAGVNSAAVTVYNSLYFGLLMNLDAAMFALLAFYIASASYRAFRVRTLEAGLLMASALIVMLGFVNFGVFLTSWIPIDSSFAWLRVENISSFILGWINMPAYRAVVIGVGVGMLAMGLRLWLSLERGSFFSQEK